MADDTAMDVDPQAGVFASVVYTIIERADLTLEHAEDVCHAAVASPLELSADPIYRFDAP